MSFGLMLIVGLLLTLQLGRIAADGTTAAGLTSGGTGATGGATGATGTSGSSGSGATGTPGGSGGTGASGSGPTSVGTSTPTKH